MNILNTFLDPDMFSFKEGIIGGDECTLIGPNDIKCKWNEYTLPFRSVIIRKSDNKVISRGFPKFFNWSEQPDLDPFPNGPFEAIEKKDGSLIIWGVHNDELIHRTRGTFNAQNMTNGHEIEFLISKYSKLIEAIKIFSDYSILTEWQTKTNVIVINEVAEPTLTLVGMIHNDTQKMSSQIELDIMGKAWGVDRPKRFHYNNISECIADVEMWNGKEGVVVYSLKYSNCLRKIKSEWYCELHKLATGIKTVENVVDIFLTTPKFMTSKEFYDYLEEVIDHEVAEKIKDDIVIVIDAYNKTLFKIDAVGNFIKTIRGDSYTRKDQALEIVERYNDWRRSLAFLLLDNKDAPDKLIKQGMMEVINEA